MPLGLAVLDGLPPEVVIHLQGEDGRRAALILRAGITCGGRTADTFHANPSLSFQPICLHASVPVQTACAWGRIRAGALICATLFPFYAAPTGLHRILFIGKCCFRDQLNRLKARESI